MPLVSSDIQSHHVAAWLEKKAAYLWKVRRWCNFHVLLCQKRCCSPFTSDRSVRFLVLKVSSKIDMGMATWCDMGHPLPQPATIARSKELVARLHQWHFHVLVLLQLPLCYLQHLPGHAKISAQVIIFHQSEKTPEVKHTVIPYIFPVKRKHHMEMGMVRRTRDAIICSLLSGSVASTDRKLVTKVGLTSAYGIFNGGFVYSCFSQMHQMMISHQIWKPWKGVIPPKQCTFWCFTWFCAHLISSLHLITFFDSKTHSGLVKFHCDSQVADLTPPTGDQAVAIDLDWFTTSILQPYCTVFCKSFTRCRSCNPTFQMREIMLWSKVNFNNGFGSQLPELGTKLGSTDLGPLPVPWNNLGRFHRSMCQHTSDAWGCKDNSHGLAV